MIHPHFRAGFTLLDALLGIAVIAIGLLAAVGLQTSSLQSNAKAEQLTLTYEAARGELEWWLERTLPTGNIPDGESSCATIDRTPCKVIVERCDVADGTFKCNSDKDTNLAYRVTVDYEGPRGDTVLLSSVAIGDYIDGAIE